MSKCIDDHLTSKCSSKSLHIQYLLNFIPKLFIGDDSAYKLSSWLGSQVLKDNTNQVLIYPSAINEEYTNFAFTTKTADICLQLTQVLTFKVIEKQNSSVHTLTPGRVGNVLNGRLKYRLYKDADKALIDSILL